MSIIGVRRVPDELSTIGGSNNKENVKENVLKNGSERDNKAHSSDTEAVEKHHSILDRLASEVRNNIKEHNYDRNLHQSVYDRG
jgi:hypothetical protein